jgi:hypothetical protein
LQATFADSVWFVDLAPLTGPALELTATRVKMLAVEKITARLDDCFHLLTNGGRTALTRQQTLRAAIDWRYERIRALGGDQARPPARRTSWYTGQSPCGATSGGVRATRIVARGPHFEITL